MFHVQKYVIRHNGENLNAQADRPKNNKILQAFTFIPSFFMRKSGRVGIAYHS